MTDCEKIEGFEYEDFGESKANDDGFVIVSDLQCEWALKRIKKAKEEHDRLVDLAKQEIAELNEQITKLDEKLGNETGYLKILLFDYFGKVEHKQTKTQESYKLLSGSLVWKKPATKIKKPDEEKLLEILKEVDPVEAYVETIKKPKWAEFKKTLTISDNKIVDEFGEVIEGIELEEAPGEFDVKI